MSPTTGRRWRQAVVKRLPVAAMEYPFETFIAVLGMLLGLALALGTFRPDSLFSALPPAATVAYIAAAVTGAGTVLVGLVPRRKNPIPMAVGLRLLAVLFTVYAGAVVYFAGVPRGGMTALCFAFIAALALFRSLYLRASAEAALDAHRGG